MRSNEVICTAVLPSEREQALDLALASAALRQRVEPASPLAGLGSLQAIYQRACAMISLSRFLHRHGIAHTSPVPEALVSHDDLPGMQIDQVTAGLIIETVPRTQTNSRQIISALAFIPEDGSWARCRQYQRLIFLFFAGVPTLTVRQQLSSLLQENRIPAREEIILPAFTPKLFITAAPTLIECKRTFSVVPAGAPCLQHPNGVPVAGMGCRVAALTSFKNVVHWSGV